jgi:hypothetical protein
MGEGSSLVSQIIGTGTLAKKMIKLLPLNKQGISG